MLFGILAKEVIEAFTPEKPQKQWGKSNGVGVGDVPPYDVDKADQLAAEISNELFSDIGRTFDEGRKKQIKQVGRGEPVKAPIMNRGVEDDFEYGNK